MVANGGIVSVLEILGSTRCCTQQSTPWNHGTFFVEGLERGCCADRFVQLVQSEASRVPTV